MPLAAGPASPQHAGSDRPANGASVHLVDGQHEGAIAAHRDVAAADVEGERGIVLLFGLQDQTQRSRGRRSLSYGIEKGMTDAPAMPGSQL